jgi:ligand-binding sensor domain-containing protein
MYQDKHQSFKEAGMSIKGNLYAKRRLRKALVLLPLLITILGALACSTSGEQPTSTIPAATATETPIPTSTPTPTPTPIPAPQGVWSQFGSDNYNDVEDLEMDGEGFLWGRGATMVIRWDPNEGTYQEFGVSQGLPSNSAQDMFVGPQGKIWLSFSGHGLWRFDDPDWMTFIEQGVVEGTRLDAYAIGPDGVLWICSDEGLSKYDGEAWTAYQVTDGFAVGFCRYLTIDKLGNPWMQGTYGISVFHEPDDWVLYDPVNSSSGETIDYRYPIGAHTAPDGTLWFAFIRGDFSGGDVLYLDGDEWYHTDIRMAAFSLSSTGQPWVVQKSISGDTISNYVYGTYLKIGPPGNENPVWLVGYHWDAPFHDRMPTDFEMDYSFEVASFITGGGSIKPAIFPGLNGEMWIRSGDGLLHIRGNSISLIPIEGISSASNIRDVEISRHGDVFLALPDGISRLSGTQLTPLHVAPVDLSGNTIYELDVAPDGTLWVYSSGGLQSFDGVTWTGHSAPSFAADMEIAPNGDVWLAHRHFGVSCLDGTSWEQFYPGSVPGYLDGSVDALGIGADGVVWLGIQEVGVSSFDGSQWTAYPFDDGMVIDRIKDLLVDRNGNIYLTSENHQMHQAFLLHYDGTSWSSVEIQDWNAILAMDPDGSVWFAEGSMGVYRIQDGELVGENLAEGLPIESIDAMQFSPDGSLWLGTGNGAWRYDGVEWQSFLPQDALFSDVVSVIAIGSDSTVWFGGTGLARYGAP